MPELTVRECMHEGVIACAPDTPVEEVAETMQARGISALVVVAGGRAVGVISKTDLVNVAFIAPYMRHWQGMTARHLMTSPVVSVGPDTPFADAVRLLDERHIHRLVVTGDGERPIGILSLTDVARVVSARTAGSEARS